MRASLPIVLAAFVMQPDPKPSDIRIDQFLADEVRRLHEDNADLRKRITELELANSRLAVGSWTTYGWSCEVAWRTCYELKHYAPFVPYMTGPSEWGIRVVAGTTVTTIPPGDLFEYSVNPDADGDGDLDLLDFARLQNIWNKKVNPASQ